MYDFSNVYNNLVVILVYVVVDWVMFFWKGFVNYFVFVYDLRDILWNIFVLLCVDCVCFCEFLNMLFVDGFYRVFGRDFDSCSFSKVIK